MFLKEIFQDWSANRGNAKGRYVLASFRVASLLEKNPILKVFFFPLYLHHKIWVSWVMGVELQSKVVLGRGCRLYHGQGLVINSKTIIGQNCILRHSVTIGNKIEKNGMESASPIIGDNCEIGAHSAILGPVVIGDNVTIGALSLVISDIPTNAVALGIPAQVKRLKTELH
ncbi:MAG: serine acetyltransferase [Cyclobacteriaceae bacterium]